VILPSISDPLVFGCSDVLVTGANGTVYHGRHLDYDMRLRGITARVDFVRAGEIVYSSAHWIGQVGSATLKRPHGWSIAQNTRSGPAHGSNYSRAILDHLFLRKRVPMEVRLRASAEAYVTYEQAINGLRTVPLPSPSYFILAGAQPREGGVIARDADGYTYRHSLDVPQGRFSLIQSNYDDYMGDPIGDDRGAVLRRALAEVMNQTSLSIPFGSSSAGDLKEVGPPDFGVADMWKVLLQTHCCAQCGEKPPFNSNTVYSTVMVPSVQGGVDDLVVHWQPGPHSCRAFKDE